MCDKVDLTHFFFWQKRFSLLCLLCRATKIKCDERLSHLGHDIPLHELFFRQFLRYSHGRTTISQDVQTRFPVKMAFAKFLSKIKGNF